MKDLTGFFTFINLYYFKKKEKIEILTLINSTNKVSTINPAYIAKLNLQIQISGVSNKKILNFPQKTYGIVIFILDIFNKLGCLRFFEPLFIFADINIKAVICKFILTFSNVEFYFTKRKLV